MEGETRQHWYQLMGRGPSVNEIQGEILIIMSFMVSICFIKLEIFLLEQIEKGKSIFYLIDIKNCCH